MSEAKHTPGPWRVDDGAEDYYKQPEGAPPTLGIYGGDADFCFAVMVTDVFTPEQIAANANLIAAAPELYAQLEFAVTLLGAFPTLNGTAQIDAMRAALAKARGEA